MEENKVVTEENKTLDDFIKDIDTLKAFIRQQSIEVHDRVQRELKSKMEILTKIQEDLKSEQ